MRSDHDSKPVVRTDKSHGGCAALVVVALILLPVLYVASVGPALWLFEHGVVSERQILAFYAPINWAAKSNRTFGKAVDWYVALWVTPATQ